MVFSGLILFLAPQIGMFMALVLVGTPSFVIAKRVADKQAANEPIISYNIDQWVDDMMAAEAKGLALPPMEAYVVIEPRVEKTRVAKQKKISSRPTFEQISIAPRIRTKKPTFQPV